MERGKYGFDNGLYFYNEIAMGDKQYRDLSDEVKELHWDLIAIKPDQRSLGLLESCPLNPHAWILRRLLVERLQLDLNVELKRVGRLLKNDAKNYQKWYHRRWIVEKIGPSATSRELEFTKKIIEKDPNNFAAWFHRRWVILKFRLDLEDELRHCEKFFGGKRSCIYAWEQKYHLLPRSWWFDVDFEYLIRSIVIKPEDQCPWEFIRRYCMSDHLWTTYNRFVVEDTCATVLRVAIKHAESVEDASVINIKGCLNALDMTCDLITSGFPVNGMLIHRVKTMYQSPLGFVAVLCSTLEGGRVWSRLVNTWRRHMKGISEEIGLSLPPRSSTSDIVGPSLPPHSSTSLRSPL